jgi:hypothetical protein
MTNPQDGVEISDGDGAVVADPAAAAAAALATSEWRERVECAEREGDWTLGLVDQ